MGKGNNLCVSLLVESTPNKTPIKKTTKFFFSTNQWVFSWVFTPHHLPTLGVAYNPSQPSQQHILPNQRHSNNSTKPRRRMRLKLQTTKEFMYQWVFIQPQKPKGKGEHLGIAMCCHPLTFINPYHLLKGRG